jgi:hypothetical protein
MVAGQLPAAGNSQTVAPAAFYESEAMPVNLRWRLVDPSCRSLAVVGKRQGWRSEVFFLSIMTVRNPHYLRCDSGESMAGTRFIGANLVAAVAPSSW